MGEVTRINDDGKYCVKFPKDTWSFPGQHLRPASAPPACQLTPELQGMVDEGAITAAQARSMMPEAAGLHTAEEEAAAAAPEGEVAQADAAVVGQAEAHDFLFALSGDMAPETPSASAGEQTDAPEGSLSYVDLLLQSGGGSHPLVADATHFVSHAWKYRFHDFVSALETFEAQNDASHDRFYWFDVLCVNQHMSQQLPQEWWSSTFRDAIQKMGHTLVVLSPWNQPVPLTRAWCL